MNNQTEVNYHIIEKIIEDAPQLLRTLPAFFAIQTNTKCPKECQYCPYPELKSANKVPDTVMNVNDFQRLLDKIVDFAGDAVIDISAWGELSLHPEKLELINAVLSRKNLSLIIETCGLGWTQADFDAIQKIKPVGGSLAAPKISWIVSLDSDDTGISEASVTAKTLAALFPENVHVQAIRTNGVEAALKIEKFYRYWKDGADAKVNVIIQKYDYFCGKLPALKAGDISPIVRLPCWHLMRDMNILVTGDVNVCREDFFGIIGNVFDENNGNLEKIYENGRGIYEKHCKNDFSGLCKECDEFYTYNF